MDGMTHIQKKVIKITQKYLLIFWFFFLAYITFFVTLCDIPFYIHAQKKKMKRLISWTEEGLRDVVEALYNSAGKPNGYPGAEVHEDGYNWEMPEAYTVTEINGTHHEIFEITKGAHEWMDVESTIKKILDLSSKFPGWRHLYVDGFSDNIRFEINGGKWIRGQTSNSSA